MFGLKAIVAQKNKGRGRVVVRVGGLEVKMERHQLGVPLLKGGLRGLVGSDDDSMSAKDKKLLKMLQEELVDPDKMLG